MKRNLTNFSLLLTALVFATVSLTGCGGSSSSDPAVVAPVDPPVDLGDYLYATDADTTIDLVFGTDYMVVDTWGSGAVHDNAHALDTDYNPCFSVDNTTAPVWGGLGAVAFTGFTAGDFSSYTALHFKFKADSDTAANVKFPGATLGTDGEITYNVDSATDLGNGWYDFSVRLANHGDLSAVTELAILATGDFYITDIYLTDAVVTVPAAGDLDGGGSFYLKSGDGNNEIDLRFGTEYQDITVWSSGTAIADVVDAEYGNVWTMTPGWDWGRSAAAIAFINFSAGSFSDYTTLTFKFNPGAYTAINVKFPGATTQEEIVYDLATYGTAIGTAGWYEVSVPMSGHGDVSATTELAILTDGATDFSVTDIFFQ